MTKGSTQDWEKNLKEAKANLKKMFGDYRVGDFTFRYDGDMGKGKVKFTHKKGKGLDLEVIKEAGSANIMGVPRGIAMKTFPVLAFALLVAIGCGAGGARARAAFQRSRSMLQAKT